MRVNGGEGSSQAVEAPWGGGGVRRKRHVEGQGGGVSMLADTQQSNNCTAAITSSQWL